MFEYKVLNYRTYYTEENKSVVDPEDIKTFEKNAETILTFFGKRGWNLLFVEGGMIFLQRPFVASEETE